MNKKKTKEYWLGLVEKHGSADTISKAIGIKYQTVRWNLNKWQIPISKEAVRRQRAKEISPEDLATKYKELKSASKTAKHFGISKDQVLARLPEKLKAENRLERYACDETFFIAESEASLYYAGFILADGCVTLKDGKYKMLQIGLARKDRCILEGFRDAIKFEGPIHDYEYWDDEQQKYLPQSQMVISSDKIFDSLVKFGIVPNKTLTVKFPEWLNRHPLVHHFVRGLFDGDGSVGNYKEGGRPTKQCKWSFLGTESVVDAIRLIIEKDGAVPKGSGHKKSKKGCWCIEYGGNGMAQTLREWLYRDATIYLKRKHRIFFDENVRDHVRPPPPEATRLAANEARRIPIMAKNLKTNAEIHFGSIKEVAPTFHAGIVSDCLRGVQKTHRGHVFKKEGENYPEIKVAGARHNVSQEQAIETYKKLKNLSATARALGITYGQIRSLLPKSTRRETESGDLEQ